MSTGIYMKMVGGEFENSTDMLTIMRQQRLGFITPVYQPAVLISQIQRSGGTLLSQLLDGHSELHVRPSELHIGRPSKYYWPDLDIKSSAEDLYSNLYENIFSKYSRRGYQKQSKAEKTYNEKYEEEVLPFLFDPKLQAELFVQMSKVSKFVTQRDVINKYITSYFNAWLDYQGLYRDPNKIKYWVAFVPRLTGDSKSYDRFCRDYPDGRLICIVRNPVSWYASAYRHSLDYQDPVIAATLWQENYNSIIKSSLRNKQNILFIHFEELVGNLIEIMGRLCRFLSIEFEEVLLKPTFNGLPIKSDSSFGSKYGIDVGAIDRSNTIPKKVVGIIKQITNYTYCQLCDFAGK